MSTSAPAGSAPAAAAAEDTVLTHRQIVTILIGLMMAMFLAALDQTVVSTAMRTIADDLGGFSLQAWATTAFLITSTISTPLYGKLSDIYGRKPFILFSIGIFIVGSVLCGVAGNIYQLAAFRAVQGIGAGGLFSLAFAIIGDVVPPRERAKYQGYFLAVFGTSSVLGPVLGGFFAGSSEILGVTGWRWIFYINVPIALAAFLVVMRVLHIPHRRQDHRIDWPGALTLIVTLVPLLTVAEQGREWGWGSGRSLLCYGIGAVGLVLFLLAEFGYKDDALLPMRLFRGRTFSVASISSFILGMAMFGGLLTLPLYLQIVKGATPTKAGLMLLPLVLGIMSGSIISGQVIARTGRYRIFPIVGAALMLAALVLFSRIGADTPLWRTMLIMALMGLGLGGNMQPVITAVQNAASPREIGVATSTVTFFRSMGGTLGAAVFLSILFSLLPDKIRSAFTAAQSTTAFRSAAAAHPDQVAALQSTTTSGSSSSLNDTSFLEKLDATLAHPFKVGFSDSMSVVFLVASAIMVAGLIAIQFLPEIALRSMSAAQARAAEDAAADGAAAAAASPAAGAALASTAASASAAGAAEPAPAGAPASSAAGGAALASTAAPASADGGAAPPSASVAPPSTSTSATASTEAGTPFAAAASSSASASAVTAGGDGALSVDPTAGSAFSAASSPNGGGASPTPASPNGGPTAASSTPAAISGDGTHLESSASLSSPADSAGGAHEADAVASPASATHAPAHARQSGVHEADGEAPTSDTEPRHSL
ncbi:MDR family MFS transporter [Dactylosporangium darangshiense]|uniref:Major facilitator superfamily (MFS) profile domain-containing protein n=1 Tax=Dactylosporangium darangshiense TaxID=579108 RepID=A0ABP8DGG4_9ACTN